MFLFFCQIITVDTYIEYTNWLHLSAEQFGTDLKIFFTFFNTLILSR